MDDMTCEEYLKARDELFEMGLLVRKWDGKAHEYRYWALPFAPKEAIEATMMEKSKPKGEH